HFEPRGIDGIAQQGIAHGEGQPVHGSRAADALAVIAVAAEVLHRDERVRADDLDHRITRSGWKRMRSPGASSDGGSRAGSKKRMSAAPMVCQPLGPAEAETPVCRPAMESEPAGT